MIIEQQLYNQILSNMPILCVDAVIIDKTNKVLLLKRKNEPAKNSWWFPGGRLQKGETLENAVVRKANEETGLDLTLLKSLGVTQTIFDTGPNDIPVHTVNFTFLLFSSDTSKLNIDRDHEDFIWTNNFDDLDLHPEVLTLLKNNKLQ